jgi:hypothetical protein
MDLVVYLLNCFHFFGGGGSSTQKNSPENTKAKKLDGLEIFGGQFTEY